MKYSSGLTLDPQAVEIFKLLAADEFAGRRYCDVSPQDARSVAVARRSLLNIEPEKVDDVIDQVIPGPNGPISIRVYVPRFANQKKKLPAFIHFHGGGFVLCNLETHDPQCRYWANHSGCIVVSVDYRLAPEHKFPAAVEDCFATILWISEYGNTIGIDRDRIAIGGESAGGNLAAVVAQLSKSVANTTILLQVLSVPITDMRFEDPSNWTYATGYGLEHASLKWFRENYLNDDSEIDDPRASPLKTNNLGELPSALVITAGFDPLRDQGRAYADRMTLAQVPVEYVCFEGMPHPFVGWGGRAPIVLDYMDVITTKLRKTLVDSV